VQEPEPARVPGRALALVLALALERALAPEQALALVPVPVPVLEPERVSLSARGPSVKVRRCRKSLSQRPRRQAARTLPRYVHSRVV